MPEVLKKILALDPATRCGWALHCPGSAMQHGVWNLGAHRTEPQKLLRLVEHVRPLLPVDLIAMEHASFGGVGGKGRQTIQWAQIVWQSKLCGVVEMLAAEFDCEVVLLSPTTIKSFMCGSGRAKKDQVRRAVKRLLDVDTVDDNDSDAVAILELAKRPDCWPVKERVRRKSPRGGTRKQGGLLW